MNYNGKELDELTASEWNGKAREVLAWNTEYDTPTKLLLVGYDPSDSESVHWIIRSEICCGGNHLFYVKHVADIPTNVSDSPKDYIIGKRYRCLCGKKYQDKYFAGYTIATHKIFQYEGNGVFWQIDIPRTYTNSIYCADDFDSIEEYIPRRATFRELSRWLGEGKGEFAFINGSSNYLRISTHLMYPNIDENKFVYDTMRVRKWTDEEWVLPTTDYMGIDEQDESVNEANKAIDVHWNEVPHVTITD